MKGPDWERATAAFLAHAAAEKGLADNTLAAYRRSRQPLHRNVRPM